MPPTGCCSMRSSPISTRVPEGKQVMLKLSIPREAGLFQPLVDHPKVLRVVALSGGFGRDEACRELARNPGMIASFRRALLADLRHDMSRRGIRPQPRHRDRRHSQRVGRLTRGVPGR